MEGNTETDASVRPPLPPNHDNLLSSSRHENTSRPPRTPSAGSGDWKQFLLTDPENGLGVAGLAHGIGDNGSTRSPLQKFSSDNLLMAALESFQNDPPLPDDALHRSESDALRRSLLDLDNVDLDSFDIDPDVLAGFDVELLQELSPEQRRSVVKSASDLARSQAAAAAAVAAEGTTAGAAQHSRPYSPSRLGLRPNEPAAVPPASSGGLPDPFVQLAWQQAQQGEAGMSQALPASQGLDPRLLDVQQQAQQAQQGEAGMSQALPASQGLDPRLLDVQQQAQQAQRGAAGMPPSQGLDQRLLNMQQLQQQDIQEQQLLGLPHNSPPIRHYARDAPAFTAQQPMVPQIPLTPYPSGASLPPFAGPDVGAEYAEAQEVRRPGPDTVTSGHHQRLQSKCVITSGDCSRAAAAGAAPGPQAQPAAPQRKIIIKGAVARGASGSGALSSTTSSDAMTVGGAPPGSPLGPAPVSPLASLGSQPRAGQAKAAAPRIVLAKPQPQAGPLPTRLAGGPHAQDAGRKENQVPGSIQDQLRQLEKRKQLLQQALDREAQELCWHQQDLERRNTAPFRPAMQPSLSGGLEELQAQHARGHSLPAGLHGRHSLDEQRLSGVGAPAYLSQPMMSGQLVTQPEGLQSYSSAVDLSGSRGGSLPATASGLQTRSSGGSQASGASGERAPLTSRASQQRQAAKVAEAALRQAELEAQLVKSNPAMANLLLGAQRSRQALEQQLAGLAAAAAAGAAGPAGDASQANSVARTRYKRDRSLKSQQRDVTAPKAPRAGYELEGADELASLGSLEAELALDPDYSPGGFDGIGGGQHPYAHPGMDGGLASPDPYANPTSAGSADRSASAPAGSTAVRQQLRLHPDLFLKLPSLPASFRDAEVGEDGSLTSADLLTASELPGSSSELNSHGSNGLGGAQHSVQSITGGSSGGPHSGAANEACESGVAHGSVAVNWVGPADGPGSMVAGDEAPARKGRQAAAPHHLNHAKLAELEAKVRQLEEEKACLERHAALQPLPAV
ncbi:hypothetical protein WJX72_012451 [[Myrmecia] bisecta]|uniref:Uncharacterized protein n=1 Tax=[Myrmecia] bisecta TaxID=41462 RepID=A0AAW1PYW0_9CHLO